jgi:hypothetical protein
MLSPLYYNQHARFDRAQPLTEEELRAKAPSIFAVTPHESRSHRFKAIPTIEVLRGLQAEGFSPVAVCQSVCRDKDRAPFTKHLVRLRRLDEAAKYSVGDSVLEVLLKNANDGTSAYDLLAGMFRIRCLNSLVAQTSTIDCVKVRHSGDVQHKVIDATYHVINQATGLLAAPQDWPRITLSSDERMVFANAAHVARFSQAEPGVQRTGVAEAIKPHQLLAVRRRDDQDPHLWNVFNTVQENVIRGGLYGSYRDAGNHTRRTSTREIKGIDQNVKLNQPLWVLAEEMARLKSAH